VSLCLDAFLKIFFSFFIFSLFFVFFFPVVVCMLEEALWQSFNVAV